MPQFSTFVGSAAAALVLLTFTTREMRTLRLIAICSNVAFIAYGALDWLPPIVLLHVTLLPLNLLRLIQLKKAAPAAAIPPLQGPLRIERLEKVARGQWLVSLAGSDDRPVTLSLVLDRASKTRGAAIDTA
jgi:hypothetical protein